MKKGMILILTLVLALAFSACGGSKNKTFASDGNAFSTSGNAAATSGNVLSFFVSTPGNAN